MNVKQAILLDGKEKSLSRRHPWLFSGALKSVEKGVQEGDMVRVFSNKGDFLCVGLWQSGSIAIKILSFEDVEVNYGFMVERVRKAVELRRLCGLFDDGDTTIFRLVNGEGDFLPSLIADYYEGLVVLQFHSVGMWRLREEIVGAFKEVLQSDCKAVFSKSSSTLPKQSGISAKDEFLFGSLPEDWFAKENGLTYRIDYAMGQKTGFFIDQRENRRLVGEYAKGKRVLNAFAYTGGFSLSALKGMAKEVVSLDISARAVEICEKNAEMNFPQSNVHRGEVADVLDYLDTLEKGRFDLIILDPPAFAKHRAALRNALKGYTRLNVKGLQRIKPGGILFTFSCSQIVTKENFRAAVFTAAVQANRKVRILHQIHQPADHPINIYHPEGEYLKGLVLYVE